MPRIIDDFFSAAYFSFLRMWADTRIYAPCVNPIDGVEYPGICPDFPDNDRTRGVIERRLADAGVKGRLNYLFMRLTLGGTLAPHMVHSDRAMGDFTFLLYMTPLVDCKGGTYLLRHNATGLEEDPDGWRYRVTLMTDQNDLNAWTVTQRCFMKPNRAFVLPAKRFHMAEPVGGFGTDARNGRLVMVGFGTLH